MPRKLKLPIPITLPAERIAVGDLFLDLGDAFYATTFPIDQPPDEADINSARVAVAVMVAHARGLPMNAAQIAKRLRMAPSTVGDKLTALRQRHVIRHIGGRYYLEPERAKNVPHQEAVNLILAKAYSVLGPHLAKIGS